MYCACPAHFGGSERQRQRQCCRLKVEKLEWGHANTLVESIVTGLIHGHRLPQEVNHDAQHHNH